MSEEIKKKKAELAVFFLVGPDSSTSEDSSTIEYSASALKEKYIRSLNIKCVTIAKPFNIVHVFISYVKSYGSLI